MTNKELVEKWERVLDYTDDDTPPLLNEWKRIYLANMLENTEEHFFKYMRRYDSILLKIMVPQMRRNEGHIDKQEIGGSMWDIVTVKNIDKSDTYAINPDTVMIERGNHPAFIEIWLKNCYKMTDIGWEWKKTIY